MTKNSALSEIFRHIEEKKTQFLQLSDEIWGIPELSFHEFKSMDLHKTLLELEGFRTQTGVGGIPTAVIGEWGEDGPVIAVLGEYDALPGLSQVAGISKPEPMEPGGPGHGCGHNLLGTAGLQAATAVKDWLKESGLKGRVRYYGCPAEENSSVKAFMVRDGLFDDVDAALAWHPASLTRVDVDPQLAFFSLDFHFKGISAHASSSPHNGRSALDAAELMNVGANFLREHITSDCRIHYAFIDSGGKAANVVHSNVVTRYSVRANQQSNMLGVVERVKRVALGAATMTDTEVSWSVNHATAPLLCNSVLARVMQANLDLAGPIPFDANDIDFARALQQTLAPHNIEEAFQAAGVESRDMPIADFVMPLQLDNKGGGIPLGSTDVGDVSWAVPLVHLNATTVAFGTPLHTWQMVAQGKSGIAHKGMVHAATMMAATAVDLFCDPDLLEGAKAEHACTLAKTPYVSAIPADVVPPIVERPANP